ncbi:MAG: UDP-glucose 4-epimerase GalE [Cytophagales bacterium]
MQKIIVTGGAGFIGSHTVVELYKGGFQPVIIDNFVNSEKSVCQRINTILNDEIEVLEIDCNDYSELKRKTAELGEIFGIIHFAAYKAVGESVKEPLKYYQNNLLSLINLLRLSEELQIKNFVFSSSCTVYGQPNAIAVDESAAILPAESPYGNTKQVGEEIIRDLVRSKSPVKFASLRYFNPIGAHDSSLIGELPIGIPNNLVPFITQTAAGIRKELIIFGDDYPTADGTNIRDYIHVVDLAKAHVKAIEYLLKLKEECYLDYFNLGTGKGSSVLEVVKTFEKVNGIKLNYKIGSRREGDVAAIYAIVDKANKELDWNTEKTLADGLRDAWNWQKTLMDENI